MNAWLLTLAILVGGMVLATRRALQLEPEPDQAAGRSEESSTPFDPYEIDQAVDQLADQAADQVDQVDLVVDQVVDQAPAAVEAIAAIGSNIMTKAVSTLGLWRPPAAYAPLIAAAEDAHGIPRDLLARLLYQESRYRKDIITGATRSTAGALGIAQFMPATAAELGIDPLDPVQAIPAAARYLAGLYRRTGNWAEALAAYNWGIGNLQRRGLAAAPKETRNYYAQILADVDTGAA